MYDDAPILYTSAISRVMLSMVAELLLRKTGTIMYNANMQAL